MKGFNPNKLNIGAYILQPYARSEKHIQQIKEANIDFIVSMSSDKPTLDIFQKYGLGAIVNDVFPHWWGGDGENSGKMSEFNPVGKYEEALQGFADHSAIWGIDIGDEISSMDFEHCKSICSCCAPLLGDKFIYTNLYASYGVNALASCGERKKQWGCDTYEEYVRAYCEKVPLDYICFDHYLYSSKNRALFFDNFKCVSDMAHRYDKKLWFVGQISSSEMEKSITANQLRFQACCAMAFGAEVIMWACYTGGWWHNHVLDEKGEKTEQYEKLKAVNSEICHIANEYMKYKNTNTILYKPDCYGNDKKADSRLCTAKFENLSSASGKPLIIGEMTAKNGTGSEALFVVAAGDWNDENPYIEKIRFTSNAKIVKVHCTTGEITPQYDKYSGYYTIELKSNCAALITTEE